MGKLTKKKAKKILMDKMVKGHRLTEKQKGYFGMIAGGKKPMRAEERRKMARRKMGRNY